MRVMQAGLSVNMPVTEERALASGVVRLSAGTALSAQLGGMFGQLSVERV